MTEPANHLSSDIKKFQSLFQNAPLAILIADDRGKYVDANPAACELFGDRYETLIGKTIFDFVPTGESQKVKVEWSRFYKKKTTA
jgi:PAS domain S-box-containing protein